MSKKLNIVMEEAEHHWIEHKRSVIIFVPNSMIMQAYAVFNNNKASPKYVHISADSSKSMTISADKAYGQSIKHYDTDTIYIINPQDMDDKLLKELKSFVDIKKGTAPMLICVKI